MVPIHFLPSGIPLRISSIPANLNNAYIFHKEEYHEGDLVHIKLSQEVSFLNKAAIKNALEKLPHGANVLIDASDTSYIDFDVLEIIREFAAQKASQKEIQVKLSGFKEKYEFHDADFVHCETDINGNITEINSPNKSVFN